MKKINESTKVTLTLAQLKRLVKESVSTTDSGEPNYAAAMKIISKKVFPILKKTGIAPEFGNDLSDGWGEHSEEESPSGKFETYLQPSLGDDAKKICRLDGDDWSDEEYDDWRDEMKSSASHCWRLIKGSLKELSLTSEDFRGIRVWFVVQYDGSTSICLDPVDKPWDEDEIMDGYEAIFVNHIDL